MLREELGQIAYLSGRPALSMRIYVLPGRRYALPLEKTRTWEDHITETVVSEVGLPLAAAHGLGAPAILDRRPAAQRATSARRAQKRDRSAVAQDVAAPYHRQKNGAVAKTIPTSTWHSHYTE